MEEQKYTPTEVLDSTIAILDGIMLPKGMTAGEAAMILLPLADAVRNLQAMKEAILAAGAGEQEEQKDG